eukprot:scaffold30433_cov26-Tisochrysis_lutea.AAC.4
MPTSRSREHIERSSDGAKGRVALPGAESVSTPSRPRRSSSPIRTSSWEKTAQKVVSTAGAVSSAAVAGKVCPTEARRSSIACQRRETADGCPSVPKASALSAADARERGREDPLAAPGAESPPYKMTQKTAHK